MIEKKLVEKDVEVTVTEKRIVEMFTYGDCEYTKEDLKDHLLWEVRNECNDLIESKARSNQVVTKWRDVRWRVMDGRMYSKLYKVLDEKMKLLKDLDIDLDKD